MLLMRTVQYVVRSGVHLGWRACIASAHHARVPGHLLSSAS